MASDPSGRIPKTTKEIATTTAHRAVILKPPITLRSFQPPALKSIISAITGVRKGEKVVIPKMS